MFSKDSLRKAIGQDNVRFIRKTIPYVMDGEFAYNVIIERRRGEERLFRKSQSIICKEPLAFNNVAIDDYIVNFIPRDFKIVNNMSKVLVTYLFDKVLESANKPEVIEEHLGVMGEFNMDNMELDKYNSLIDYLMNEELKIVPFGVDGNPTKGYAAIMKMIDDDDQF